MLTQMHQWVNLNISCAHGYMGLYLTPDSAGLCWHSTDNKVRSYDFYQNFFGHKWCHHGRRQAITWTNVGILLIGPLGTNFSEMLIEIHTFSFKKINLKMSSGKWRPFCLGLNVLKKAGEVSHNIKPLNSLKPSDAKMHQWSRSSLFLVMAWCHQAPSHYLNQCWLTEKWIT